MYPAALHRFPTQTVDSSQIFERWILQKQSKIINKMTKSWQKTQLKIWNRFFPERPTIFSLDCCRWSQLYLSKYYLLHQSSALYAQILNNESPRKRLNRFIRFIFVYSDNTFHFTNFTTLNAELSSYQIILPYHLHSGVWSCVWMGNSRKSKLLHQRDLELWDSRVLPNFPLIYPINGPEPCVFLFFFCKVFPVYSSTKNVWKLSVIQTSTVPQKFLVHQNACFVGLSFLEDKTSIPELCRQ